MLLIKLRFGMDQLYLISKRLRLETGLSKILKLDSEFIMKTVRRQTQMEESLMGGLQNLMNGLLSYHQRLPNFIHSQKLQELKSSIRDMMTYKSMIKMMQSQKKEKTQYMQL